MKKNLMPGLLLWCLTLILIVSFLVYHPTHVVFMNATKSHPYLMGFTKVAILATMGELLAIAISTGEFKRPKGLIYRFIVWGFLGMSFTVVFDMFATGVGGSMAKGLLPKANEGSTTALILGPFLTSTFMNIVFGPTFMAFHRITDTFIDLGEGKLSSIFKVKLKDVVNKIDWYGFISFVVLRTVPIFWIPAHTITFMLPPEYRVLMAAFLSIALGAILASAKRKNTKTV